MDKQALDDWFMTEVIPLEPALMRFLRRRWRNPSDLPDLRQEIYVRVYEAASVVRPNYVRGFLFTTARNWMIDRMRRSSVVPIDAIPDLEALNVTGGEPSPERHANAREELKLLQLALNNVPPRAREAIVLRKVEGLSQRDTAERMGIQEDGVERHLREGLRFLAEALLDTDMALGRAGAAVRAQKSNEVEP